MYLFYSARFQSILWLLLESELHCLRCKCSHWLPYLGLRLMSAPIVSANSLSCRQLLIVSLLDYFPILVVNKTETPEWKYVRYDTLYHNILDFKLLLKYCITPRISKPNPTTETSLKRLGSKLETTTRKAVHNTM